MEELSYSTVYTVIESWESLRHRRGFIETMGRGLLIKFFQERPDAVSIFGFEVEKSDHSDSNSNSYNDSISNSISNSNSDQSSLHEEEKEEEWSEEAAILYGSENFSDIGKNFVNFVDQAVNMLGPDLATFTDVFVDLGEKHHLIQYNLSSKFYPILGRALLAQVEEMLGPDIFTIQTRAAWLKVFQALSLDLTPPPPKRKTSSDRKCKKNSPKNTPTFFKKRPSNERRHSGERRKSNEKRNFRERRFSMK